MKHPATAVTTAVTPSSPDRPPTIWPSVPYPDPQAAIDFLVATFGFEPTALIPGDAPGSYAEIELRWPHGSGGVIIRRWDRPAPNWLYVVTPDPDGLYQRAKAAGLEITREIEDTHYGSRTFTVVDPWSVCWTFGTYPGS
ncbi:MAG TPA: VOC family protein [Streptosporangiaceae bacterium]|nr:VOC family protein [Streptosporangiaceae bacterium]